MSYSNGIITRPVVITPSGGDIGQALGVALNSLGDLITQGPINPWAKFKPVRFATLEDTGESATEQPNYWKANDGMCGFSVPESTNTTSGPSTSSSAWYKLLNSLLLWTYNRPSGALLSQPFRENDFDGYDHNAPQPIIGPTTESIMLTSDNKLKVQIGSNRGSNRSIQLSDLTLHNVRLDNWYVGVLVYYSNSSGEWTFKTGGLVSSGNLDVEFTNMLSYGGRNVQIVPFLSSGALSQGVSSNVTILSCNVAPATVRIRVYSTGIRVDLSAIWKDSLYVRVEYTCNLINETAAAITVTNIVIKLWRSGSQSPLATKTYSTDTVPASGNDPLSGILINGDAYVSTDEYYVTVESTNNVATGRATVDAPRT